MVSPFVQSAINAMSVDERLDLMAYIESTVESAEGVLNNAEVGLIRSRAADLDADPAIALSWDDLKARLAARR